MVSSRVCRLETLKEFDRLEMESLFRYQHSDAASTGGWPPKAALKEHLWGGDYVVMGKWPERSKHKKG